MGGRVVPGNDGQLLLHLRRLGVPHFIWPLMISLQRTVLLVFPHSVRSSHCSLATNISAIALATEQNITETGNMASKKKKDRDNMAQVI
jgi:hypothetical protein